MIWESKYWKTDLLKYAKRINRRKWRLRCSDNSLASIEKEIMISAFMARKLFDSKKICKSIHSKRIELVCYRTIGKKINLANRLSPERFFYLNNPEATNCKVRDVLNWIIHSYIFNIIFVNNRFRYFWFSSDRNRFEYMYQMEPGQYAKLLCEIGEYGSVPFFL